MPAKSESRRLNMIRHMSFCDKEGKRPPLMGGEFEMPGSIDTFMELKLLHLQLGEEIDTLLSNTIFLRQIDRNGTEIAPGTGITEKTSLISGTIKSTIQAVRNVAAEIQPLIGSSISPLAAIRWHLTEVQKRLGLTWSLNIAPQLPRITPEPSLNLIRLFQMILSIIESYGVATAVTVSLTGIDQSWVRFEISDNGGMITEKRIADTMSLTLLLIQERARMSGGEFRISPSGMNGTKFELMLPTGNNGGN